MKVPLGWLSEFIDLPTQDVAELSYAFDMLGLTVDGVEYFNADWSNVYVGVITDIAAHPGADKIRVCQVDTGEGPEQIICGAWNFDVGAIVPVAKPGAVLPDDFHIGKRTIRGVESNGMICSESELGLGDDHEGILVLDGDPDIGAPFSDVVDLPDVVFDLEITPNRPDAMSIVGVARDLAAYFDLKHGIPEVAGTTVEGGTEIVVEIEDPVGCRRFTGREITNVTVGPAPFQMRQRLHKVGVRSISNVVDVTNYVMFELGHPLHAFDADSIVGSRLVVKRAEEGETLVTLDDETRTLDSRDLIIYDDDGPTSMSGTMGGARSEVSSNTTRVLMEAASWDPPTIMHMWRRHDLRSEAATRFERGVDPNLADIANQRASAMVASFSGGHVLSGSIDEMPASVEPAVIKLTLEDVTRLLGSGSTVEGVTDMLTRLGLEVEGSDPMTVTVPTFRPDLTRPADLVEEVARIHGFDKFDATLPIGPVGGLTSEQSRQRKLATIISGLGFHQTIHLPFVSLDELRGLGWNTDGTDLLTVKNPLRDEEGKLRPTMLPGILGSLRYNRSHGANSAALFEVGRVFFATSDVDDPRLPKQVDRLVWAAVGDLGTTTLATGAVEVDGAFSLAVWRAISKGLGLANTEVRPVSQPGYHPGRTAEILLNGSSIGHVGELSPRSARAFEIDGRVAIAELDLVPLLADVEPIAATTPSLYPHVDFDLSFLIDTNQLIRSVLDVTEAVADGLIESIRVFDEFVSDEMDGKKAVAIRYRLRAPDRTLSAGEISGVRREMIDAAAKAGAELRGA